MPSEKPLFESRELGSTKRSDDALFDVQEPGTNADGNKVGKKKYLGPERRLENRRKQQDRRGEVRFDTKGSDRRESEGRRADDQTPKFW